MIWPVTEQQQRAGIAKMWGIFTAGQDNPIHLRAIWGKGVPSNQPVKNITFNADTYPNVADRQHAFEEKALELNKQGYNIYTCFNPISPDFEGNEHNGLSVKDVDIVRRRSLLIDLDRAQTDEPATDDEIDEIFNVAHALEKDAFYSKGHDPITVCSGNGVHIYLPIDLPRCLIPGFDGALFSQQWKEALWARYSTGAPQRLRQSVERYSIVKRA